MAGSMLGLLATDFEIMLRDWAVDADVTHITGEALDAATGTKTLVTVATTIEGVALREKAQINEFFPNVHPTADKIFYSRIADATIARGDTIAIDSVAYTVMEADNVFGLYRSSLKRI